MLTRTTPLTITAPVLLPENVTPEQVLFFDIETTGFAADVTTLYLIGCIYRQDGAWVLTQWFADDNKSEADILTAFFELAGKYALVLHYNGTGFDLPYLAKKCAKYGFDYQLPADSSFDVYKQLAPLRSLLNLPNLKQRSLTEYMGIARQDPYSGGELIQYYSQFLKARYAHLPEEETYREMLLLHNKEDLTGLIQITPMLAFSRLFTDCEVIVPAVTDLERGELILPLTLTCPLPKPLHCGNQQLLLTASDSQGTLRVLLCRKELKFFYPDYKDYFYLPEEDMAIHKSVAFYVDRNYRTKAKAANCYSRHTGCFVPQYEELLSPFFKVEYNDKTTWLETTEEFCQNTEVLTRYARHLLAHLLRELPR